MYNDQFEVRLARVRHRFATTLESKVKDAVVAAESMADSHEGGTKQISDCYRDLHSICGIGPTVGFTATGEAARAAEGTLMQAPHENRGLNIAPVKPNPGFQMSVMMESDHALSSGRAAITGRAIHRPDRSQSHRVFATLRTTPGCRWISAGFASHPVDRKLAAAIFA